MKLVCLQENLKEGLNIAEKIVGKNLALPILSNLLLSAEKGRLKISATDLEIGINTWIPAKVVSEGSLTIPAKLLSNFINNLPAKQIEFETKANVLNVKCENFKAAMNGLDAKDYPIIPKTKKAEKIEINGQILKTAFLKTAFAAALKETRPEISGIFFKFNPKEIKIGVRGSEKEKYQYLPLYNQILNSLTWGQISEGRTTFCPKCKKPAIVRRKINGKNEIENHLKEGKCVCGQEIQGVWC